MNDKLESIFKFLNANRSFNTKVQTGFYQDTLIPYDRGSQKIRSLFWQVQRTQSRPKLAYVSSFWKNIEGKDISSFKSILKSLGSDSLEITYSNLFGTLIRQPSWGGKTSALFTKALYHVHADKRYIHFSFLSDAPKQLVTDDRLYLPVDQVIINIIRKITEKRYLSFDNINSMLKEYADERMEVWDDLWFWGFITQNGTGSQRKFEWNEEKYWSLLHTPKDEKSLNRARLKAKDFIKILKA